MLIGETGSYDCPSRLVIVIWVRLCWSATSSPNLGRRGKAHINDRDVSRVQCLALRLEGVVDLVCNSQTTRTCTADQRKQHRDERGGEEYYVPAPTTKTLGLGAADVVA